MHPLLVCCPKVDIESQHWRTSYFDVIQLFGPTIFVAVVNHNHQRDARLVAEARDAIAARIADGDPRTDATYIRLKTRLELQTILCEEYRCALLSAADAILMSILSVKEPPISQS